MSYIVLNRAAIDNLLDGSLPPFATITDTDDGVCINPLKIRRGEAVDVSNGFFPVPSDIKHRFSSKKLAVRMDEKGRLIVYQVAHPLKTYQPTAKISGTAPKPTPAPLALAPVQDSEPEPAAPQSFIIRAAEVTPAIEAPRVESKPPVEDNLDAMEQRLRQRWHDESSKQVTGPVERPVLHFSAPTPALGVGEKRMVEKTIAVPVSFDRRRGLGTRAVEVMIKRRRTAMR